MTPRPMLDAPALAAWINTPLETLKKWRYLGEGPPFHKVGRAVRYAPDDVEAWLAANRKAA